MFKKADYDLNPDEKMLMGELKKRFKKIDDEFLSLFVKRSILFIEDGEDLKGELTNNIASNPFDRDFLTEISKSKDKKTVLTTTLQNSIDSLN